MSAILIIIFITLIFSAFFSGMEIAFLSSNRLQIELEKKQGFKSSNIISLFITHPKKYIATMLIGNNIALVVYGIFMAKILTDPISHFTDSESGILILQTLISTFIILFFAEFLPKTIFRLNSNLFLNIFAIPVSIFYFLFYPLSWATINFSNIILKRVFKANIKKNNNIVFGKVDIDNYINERMQNKNGIDDDEYELKIFQNALDFSKIKLRECIVPRTEIIAIETNDTIENLKNIFIETGYSKILVYKNNIDTIIGYVHSSELFLKPKSLNEIVHEVLIVPETMPANKLLATFIQQKRSVAVVVDEFGGTSGMVTIEDIMEEIFGEIKDEHDTDDLEDKKINDFEYLLSGRLEIDYLNEKYELNFPDTDEYETIAGYILYNHENIPKINETIIIGHYSFKILRVTNTRIELVQLKIVQE
ncbi:MAG: HlyC/CorC family transporter [Bacteroidia bacterium]|nr:HlyC/CorC family transporter [Bacteroidia bacterium]